MMSNGNSKFRPGVLYGDEVKELFEYANKNNFAIPAVNVVGTNSVNAVLETARDINSPVIIQFSNGGARFFAGKGLSNDNELAAVAGAVSGAQHIHIMSKQYGVPVVLHTDHAAKKLLPWIDGMLDAHIELEARVEQAERERDAARELKRSSTLCADKAIRERDKLQAKVEQMNKTTGCTKQAERIAELETELDRLRGEERTND